MSKDRITVAEVPTGRPNEFMQAEVSYSKGGVCYATYKNKPRGYYLSIGPVEKKDGFVSFTIFSATAILLEEAKRFNAKKLAELAAGVKDTKEYKILFARKMLAVHQERLFLGVWGTGISYADREQEVDGDYKQVAFLPFSNLRGEWNDCPDELKPAVEADWAAMLSRKGEKYEITTSGQVVVLGC